jgi:hypothetical protein
MNAKEYLEKIASVQPCGENAGIVGLVAWGVNSDATIGADQKSFVAAQIHELLLMEDRALQSIATTSLTAFLNTCRA